MTDRPFAAKTRSAPSRVSVLGRPRRPRRPRRPDVDVDVGVESRRRPHRTERDASTRSRSNRPFARIVATLLIFVHGGLFFLFGREEDATSVMHTHTLNASTIASIAVASSSSYVPHERDVVKPTSRNNQPLPRIATNPTIATRKTITRRRRCRRVVGLCARGVA
jgi:hypothetical protein